jgi:hypothetical protein
LPETGLGPSPYSTNGADQQEPLLKLPPISVLLEAVDLFFLYCHNQPYSFFHEGNFRQRLANKEVADHVLFAVLANAIRFSTNPFFNNKYEAAVSYANKSWQSIVSTCFAAHQVADVQSVQTITLLAIFDFTGWQSHAMTSCFVFVLTS